MLIKLFPNRIQITYENIVKQIYPPTKKTKSISQKYISIQQKLIHKPNIHANNKPKKIHIQNKTNTQKKSKKAEMSNHFKHVLLVKKYCPYLQLDYFPYLYVSAIVPLVLLQFFVDFLR